MALGATRHHVLRLIFRQGFFTAAIGLAMGLGLTMVLLRILRGVLPGFELVTSAYVVISAGFVALTAAVACWFPARRAATIEPISALRQD